MNDIKNENQLVDLPIDLIDLDPDQPRSEFDAEALEELAASIRESGLTEPVQVYRDKERYPLLNGSRRLKAHVLIDRKTIRALIVPRPANEAEKHLLQILSNEHRQAQTPLELAAAYRKQMELRKITASELARLVGKDRSYVSEILSLEKLDEDVKSLLRRRKIGYSKAKAIARLAKEDEAAAAQAVAELVGGKLSRDELLSRGSQAKGAGSEKAVQRVVFELPVGKLSLQGKSKLTIADTIELLEGLIRSCKKARRDKIDLSTLAAIYRDQAAAEKGGAAC